MQRSGFDRLDGFDGLDRGQVRSVVGPADPRVSDLLRSVVRFTSVVCGLPCTYLVVGSEVHAARRSMVRAEARRPAASNGPGRARERITQVRQVPVRYLGVADPTIGSITSALGVSADPVVVVDAHGDGRIVGAPRPVRDLRVGLGALAREREVAVWIAPSVGSTGEVRGRGRGRSVSWHLGPVRGPQDGLIDVEVRRGATVTGRDTLVWLPERGLVMNLAPATSVSVGADGKIVTIVRRGDSHGAFGGRPVTR